MTLLNSNITPDTSTSGSATATSISTSVSSAAYFSTFTTTATTAGTTTAQRCTTPFGCRVRMPSSAPITSDKAVAQPSPLPTSSGSSSDIAAPSPTCMAIEYPKTTLLRSTTICAGTGSISSLSSGASVGSSGKVNPDRRNDVAGTKTETTRQMNKPIPAAWCVDSGATVATEPVYSNSAVNRIAPTNSNAPSATAYLPMNSTSSVMANPTVAMVCFSDSGATLSVSARPPTKAQHAATPVRIVAEMVSAMVRASNAAAISRTTGNVSATTAVMAGSCKSANASRP